MYSDLDQLLNAINKLRNRATREHDFHQFIYEYVLFRKQEGTEILSPKVISALLDKDEEEITERIEAIEEASLFGWIDESSLRAGELALHFLQKDEVEDIFSMDEAQEMLGNSLLLGYDGMGFINLHDKKSNLNYEVELQYLNATDEYAVIYKDEVVLLGQLESVLPEHVRPELFWFSK